MAAPLVAGTVRVDEQETPLVCLGIDDEDMPRMVQEMFFRMTLKADMARSAVLGETVEEQLAFVDVALGRRGLHSLRRSTDANADDADDARSPLTPPASDAPPAALVQADVVLLDENINEDTKPEPLTGSALAGRLAAHGFRGVTCILTGASLDEIDSLRQRPGVDLVFSKGSPLSVLAEAIWRKHREKRAVR